MPPRAIMGPRTVQVLVRTIMGSGWERVGGGFAAEGAALRRSLVVDIHICAQICEGRLGWEGGKESESCHEKCEFPCTHGIDVAEIEITACMRAGFVEHPARDGRVDHMEGFGLAGGLKAVSR